MFNLNAKSRYITYAAIMAAAAAAYVWLGQAAYPPATSAGTPIAGEELPAVRFLDNGIQAKASRDLFSFVKFEQPEAAQPVSVIEAPHPVTDVAPNPGLLADLKVIGLVRRPNEVTILLQMGTTISAVGLGERFGPSDALSVEAVQGANVMIADKVQNASRLYVLSEE
jgi:hypothetical protein